MGGMLPYTYVLALKSHQSQLECAASCWGPQQLALILSSFSQPCDKLNADEAQPQPESDRSIICIDGLPRQRAVPKGQVIQLRAFGCLLFRAGTRLKLAKIKVIFGQQSGVLPIITR